MFLCICVFIFLILFICLCSYVFIFFSIYWLIFFIYFLFIYLFFNIYLSILFYLIFFPVIIFQLYINIFIYIYICLGSGMRFKIQVSTYILGAKIWSGDPGASAWNHKEKHDGLPILDGLWVWNWNIVLARQFLRETRFLLIGVKNLLGCLKNSSSMLSS